jgi:hypothetical protein
MKKSHASSARKSLHSSHTLGKKKSYSTSSMSASAAAKQSPLYSGGASAGKKPSLVLPLVIAAGVGIGIFLLTKKSSAAVALPQGTLPQGALPQGASPLPPLNAPNPIGVTPGGNPIIPVVVGPSQPRLTTSQATGLPVVNLAAPIIPGQPTLVSTLQTNGVAVNSAHALHDFLKSNGYANSAPLVLAFKVAAMSDPTAIALGGPLAMNGQFDGATSAALTMYTGDPIPADPSLAPPPPVPFNIATVIDQPGPAAQASFNLKMYYKTHAHDKTNPTEVALVKAFQTAVNTDPTVIGPASQLGFKAVTVPLVVDGDYGPVPSKPIGQESNTAKAYRLLFGNVITAP